MSYTKVLGRNLSKDGEKNDKQQPKNESHYHNASLPEANHVINDNDDDFLQYRLEDVIVCDQ